ncbi:MAG: hypothetical protein ABI691_15420 [Ginsengibacter sp.]
MLISIFGALGGISGILQLKAYLKDEPGFKFHFTTIGVGTTGPVETGETFTSIIISGTIENDGTKALNINDEGFSLKVKKPDGTIVLARKLMLPQHLVALGDSSETDYKDTKDLQTVFKIPALETVSGSVYFFVSESRASIQTDGNVFIFYCTDLKGKVYSSEHTWMIKAGRNENRIYPQTGVKIFDKNIDSNSQKIPR